MQSGLNTTLISLLKQHILVGLHINCSRSDDLEEQKCPVRGPLGTPLHSIKHATYLQNNQQIAKLCIYLTLPLSSALLMNKIVNQPHDFLCADCHPDA